jgi:membrane fusion protein, multidrug efflux system
MESTDRRKVQAERAVQQTEAELASKVLGIQQAKQRVAELKGSLARAESQRHQVPMKEADIIRAEAALTQARADLSFAELQLQYTEVRAPVEGIVSRRTVELGQVAQMGQPLLAIVPLHEVWVLANFKETQLARIRPGMRAEVSVDTFPDRVFRGTVDSLSAGTGARFSLLPPENATGNWVKVVQRLPVKIRLDAGQFGNPHTLRAGMSAVVTVKLR